MPKICVEKNMRQPDSHALCPASLSLDLCFDLSMLSQVGGLGQLLTKRSSWFKLLVSAFTRFEDGQAKPWQLTLAFLFSLCCTRWWHPPLIPLAALHLWTVSQLKGTSLEQRLCAALPSPFVNRGITMDFVGSNEQLKKIKTLHAKLKLNKLRHSMQNHAPCFTLAQPAAAQPSALLRKIRVPGRALESEC